MLTLQIVNPNNMGVMLLSLVGLCSLSALVFNVCNCNAFNIGLIVRLSSATMILSQYPCVITVPL